MKKRNKKTEQAKNNQPAKHDVPTRINQPQGDRWLLDEFDEDILRQAWLDVAQKQEKAKNESQPTRKDSTTEG